MTIYNQKAAQMANKCSQPRNKDHTGTQHQRLRAYERAGTLSFCMGLE